MLEEKMMTGRDALQQIWRDTYPKSCETWSAEKLFEHWQIVEKALIELEELKRDIKMFMSACSFQVDAGLTEQEIDYVIKLHEQLSGLDTEQ